jgi:translocation and assembly module TamA
MRPITALLFCAWMPMVMAQEPASESEPEPAQTPHAAGPALTVTWEAPKALKQIFEKNLKPPVLEEGRRRGASLRPWEREVRRRVPEIVASEGYFSPTVDIKYDDEKREHATVVVTLGTRTTVSSVEIEFAGDLAGEGPSREKRRQELRDAWALKRGEPFRSPDWESAKVKLEEDLTALDYATGRLTASRGEVDAEAATAKLSLTLDSGPPFTMGEVVIEGVSTYPIEVVQRLVDVQRGERYSRTRLEDMQRLIQNGWWFSSVVVDTERDPAKSEEVPVKITVIERPPRDVGLSAGYGTDDGIRGEASYRDRNLFSRGFDLQSSVRLSQKDQFAYADVYIPPGLWFMQRRGNIPYTDSFGVLAQHSDIENLILSRWAIAGYRHWRLENFELRAGLSYQIEDSKPVNAEENIKRALAPIVAITWRRVDNVFDPRRGGVLALQFAAGAKALASGDDFFRIYAQYQHWFPLGPDDQLYFRGELGRNFAPSRQHIPEDYLFRAGGSRSNRGYAYQSLGVQDGDAIVGGRFLATGTLEYVHWLNERWGAAVFTDVGDAADSTKEWDALKSYGVGARFRTPAGPLAIDLAYADRDRKFRIAFSVTIAF